MSQVTSQVTAPVTAPVASPITAPVTAQVTSRFTRLLGAAALCAAALASFSAAPTVAAPASEPRPLPAPAPLPVPAPAPVDHLTVTVSDAGDGNDGTYELYCRPGRGSHPDPAGACAAVDRSDRAGQDAFAPVAEGTICTMQHGGPATAHVTGTWAGRPVDTTYDRSDGCQISRWDRIVPLLPDLTPAASPTDS
ncbi:SSI family serine proteinase inhibitor [Streptomyces sp. CRN 30]|uniref:SSI family serine proteinase inhibitor n=1 Tax=Streptomyces sp. CRN 30 TaxID=3075613 RepID=UPI002A817036|nr:SSI family serine proteinase inhibitor [Streptomyces sp. CRN 30]